jgi:Phosphotransferase enzyme family
VTDDDQCLCLSAQAACDSLRKAGLSLLPAQVHVEAREDRWLAVLPAGRFAWFAANLRGRRRLEIERRVLRRLAERCSFQTPRILFESQQGWDLRAGVPGICDPWGLYQRVLTDIPLARSIGQAIGSILVEQHTRITHEDVVGWLPIRPQWPEPGDWLRQRLPRVINDQSLLSAIDGALDTYERVAVGLHDRILVHADLGLHNIAVDPETGLVRGVFDYDGACWADRHHDFRYLLFDHQRDEALEAALAVYEPAVGIALNRDPIRLYNAACAISFLAFRDGVAPEQRSCGRTLAEDLNWVRSGVAHLAQKS